ncbi:hypothetical protein FPOA_09725 [Fusarium poae]|uniref:Uncharacterized protein n=1 Tax=Fusarium poae TaxID=36050 RepID=A0A1B8ABZ7_FUSPO|nr:hypothetical protein FPOA_09725 [Fusarium poae]
MDGNFTDEYNRWRVKARYSGNWNTITRFQKVSSTPSNLLTRSPTRHPTWLEAPKVDPNFLRKVTATVTLWPAFVDLPACKALSDSALVWKIIDVLARFALFQSRATT